MKLESVAKNWWATGLRVGAWGLLLLLLMITFMVVPLLVLSI